MSEQNAYAAIDPNVVPPEQVEAQKAAEAEAKKAAKDAKAAEASKDG